MKFLAALDDILNIGLFVGKKPYHSSCLGTGWQEQGLFFSQKEQIFILLLKNGSNSGVWYFDKSKKYFSSDISQSADDSKSVFFVFVQDLINSVFFSLKEKRKLDFINVLSGNRFFRSQAEEVLKCFGGKVIPKRYTILDDYFQQSQFEFLEKKQITYKGVVYNYARSLTLSNFGFCTIYFSEKNCLFVFETTHFAKRVAYYSTHDQSLFVEGQQYNSLLSILFSHVIVFYDLIFPYFSEGLQKNAVFLRNSHIGHNLWNDLSGAFALEKKSFKSVDEIILYEGHLHDVYAPIAELMNFPAYVNINYSIVNNGDIAPYVYKNKINAVRIAGDRIPSELAGRIVEYSQKVYKDKFEESSVVVVLGLRFENRTWSNQLDGLVKVSQHLAKVFKELIIVVDGHDYCGHSKLSITSHMETADASLIDKELEVVESIKSKVVSQYPQVKLINAVNNDIRESISLIAQSNFFIAPWGAGLAKYKWICNKPGVVFTSRWNLLNKADLHIYDLDRYREDVVPSVYLTADCVTDEGVDGVNTRVPNGMEHTYANFSVDVDKLIQVIDNFIASDNKLSLLHSYKDVCK